MLAKCITSEPQTKKHKSQDSHITKNTVEYFSCAIYAETQLQPYFTNRRTTGRAGADAAHLATPVVLQSKTFLFLRFP